MIWPASPRSATPERRRVITEDAPARRQPPAKGGAEASTARRAADPRTTSALTVTAGEPEPRHDPEPAPPQAPRAAPRHPALAARAPATLDLNAIPWADVWVDGAPRGTTPVRGMSLPAGRHRVRLVNGPLGVERTMVVTLRSAETRAVVVNLREDGTNVAPRPGGPP